jgi:transposase
MLSLPNVVTIYSLLRCMVNAFEYFGGVPEVVLTDRMKTVINGM